MPTLFEQLREEGRQEVRLQEWKDWFCVVLEIKFGTKGITFYNRIQDHLTIETITRLRVAMQNDATLGELENLLKENQS